MRKESQLYDWFYNGMMKALPHFTLIERVENGLVDGMADVNYVIRGVEGWVELKDRDDGAPTRDSTPVLIAKNGIRREQENWHLRRSQKMGRTFILIRAKPHIWLIPGQRIASINGANIAELCELSILHCDTNWAKNHWEELIARLSVTRYKGGS